MKHLFILVLFIISMGHVVGQRFANHASNDAPVRDIHTSSSATFKVNYTFEGFTHTDVTISNNLLTLLHIKDFAYTREAGKPAIPSHTDLVALKHDAAFEVHVEKADSIVFHNILLAPAREPARDTEGAPEPEFIIDSVFYSKDTYFPREVVTIGDVQTYRGLSVAAVEIAPFRYNPAKKILVFYPDITYKVSYPEKSSFIRNSQVAESFRKISINSVLNNKALNDELKSKTPDKENEMAEGYLLITDDMFSEAAQKMATWKRQLGYDVTLLQHEGWSASAIKDTLSYFYHHSEIPPSYFLIIGDHDQVPGEIHYAPSGEAFASDLYYACFDGPSDYFPDMARGRLSVSSAQEAMLVADKIINYEATPPMESHFYEQGTNCAQFQDDELNGYATRRFTHTSEDIRDYMMLEQGYDVERIYYTDQNINPTNFNNGWYSNGEPIKEELLKSNGFDWSGGQWDIVNAINDGRFYLFHRDHGYAGGSGWAHPYFVKSSISHLTNGNLLPVVFSINCHTGEFKLPNSFAETLQRHPGGGAVGVFAASYYSYSGYNDGLSAGFIDAMFPEPGLVPQFGEGGIPDPDITPHEQMFTMGNVLDQGLIRMGETWGLSRYTNELFHYFGDPAMKLFTRQPETITANNPDTLFYDSTAPFAIEDINIEGVTATLVTSNQTLDVKTDVNASTVLTFDTIAADYAIVTLSKVNHRPYVDTLFIAGKPKAVASAGKTFSCDGVVSFSNHSFYNPENFTWHFGDGITSTEKEPVHEYIENGAFQVMLIAQNTFGTDTLLLSEMLEINRPALAEVSSAPVCQGEVVGFSAQEDGLYNWYSADTALLHTGPEFVTDTLNASRDYLVRRSLLSQSYTGKPDLNGDTATYHMFSGLIFDAWQSFTLKSVKVFADGDGERVIQLRDSLFNVLMADTIFIHDGAQRIELGWVIPTGEKYKLVASGNHNLKYNVTGADYPYIIPEVLSIHESTYIPEPERYYYAFYDWEISSYTCHSPMLKVQATVEQPTVASFEVEMDDPEIHIDNLSQNFTSLKWDFGDGNTSEEINPQHEFEENGDYEVVLEAENSCGKDTASMMVSINTVGYPEAEKDSYSIYPNPARDKLFISWPGQQEQPHEYFVRDTDGRLQVVRIEQSGSNKVAISLNQLSKGVYLVEIRTTDQTIFRKIVVL